MSAVRCPATLKTATFSVKDSAKTLSNMSLRAKAVSTAKIGIFSPRTNTRRGYCGQKSALSFDCRRAFVLLLHERER